VRTIICPLFRSPISKAFEVVVFFRELAADHNMSAFSACSVEAGGHCGFIALLALSSLVFEFE
jgi:hypothetical protein